MYWAKLSGVISVLMEKMDDYERELMKPIAELSGNDMVRLAIGYHDTEWMSNDK